MDIEVNFAVEQGLRRYVRLVAAELGLTGEGSFVQLEAPAYAYLALDDRLARFAGCDVALVWDEERGWAAALEAHSGEDLIVLAYLGGDVLPAPRAVARFVRDLFDDELPGEPRPALLRRSSDRDDLEARLTAYAPIGVFVPNGRNETWAASA